ncbi:hypothetical protein [Brevibacterium casei]|uniref:Phospholipase D-like domain-containing protein n=1 Tax=Brevibacterium casei TaxID=33889 RepID=A0A7T3ZXQ9_9MICO|nr:hypothetical protein [Brevibacterium casei]QQB13631.1 hypothetical protein I6H47_12595 [Brevibacterium casei]
MSPAMRVISDPSAWLESAFAAPDEDVILVSPHLARSFGERIAEAAAGSPRTWAVVTTIDPVAVAGGYLSVDGLQLLVDTGVQIQHVDRLRTHCFFVGRRALLGSPNLGAAAPGAAYLDEDESQSGELAVELTDDDLAAAWREIAALRSVVVDARDLIWLREQAGR